MDRYIPLPYLDAYIILENHGQIYPFTTLSRLLAPAREKACRKHYRKIIKCCYPAFSPFPKCILTYERKATPLEPH